MTSPAPREPTAPSESVLAALAQLDADPKLEGKGLSAAFARSFPDLPAEGFALAATEVARVAVVLDISGDFSAGCHGWSGCSNYFLRPTPVANHGALFCGHSPPLFSFGVGASG